MIEFSHFLVHQIGNIPNHFAKCMDLQKDYTLDSLFFPGGKHKTHFQPD